MAHTSRCSGAKKIRCRCSCDSLLHGGGMGRLGLSSHRTGRVAHPVPVTVPGPSEVRDRTPDRRRRAMKRAEDEINDWLAGAILNPTSLAAATSLAMDQIDDLVGGAVANELTKNGYQVGNGSHNLCDFLAALACAMLKFEKALNRYPEYMVKVIRKSRLHDRRPRIRDEVVLLTAKAALAALMKLPVVQHLKSYRLATQILAVGVCPSPETHEEVVVCCIKPLDKDIVSEVTKQQLRAVLPRGWMNGT